MPPGNRTILEQLQLEVKQTYTAILKAHEHLNKVANIAYMILANYDEYEHNRTKGKLN